MTKAEIAEFALDLLNQEATNHRFGAGGDMTRVYRYVDMAYEAVCEFGRLIRDVKTLTSTGAAGYSLKGLFTGSYIKDLGVMKVGNIAEEIPMREIGWSDYEIADKTAVGYCWGFCNTKVLTGHSAATVPWVYLIDTPASGNTFSIEVYIVPAVMANATDIPLLDLKYHRLVGRVAYKMMKAVTEGVDYDASRDFEITGAGADEEIKNVNANIRKRTSFDRYSRKTEDYMR